VQLLCKNCTVKINQTKAAHYYLLLGSLPLLI
jgi:hypothetical protein